MNFPDLFPPHLKNIVTLWGFEKTVKEPVGDAGKTLCLPARSLLALNLQRRQAASAKAGRKPFAVGKPNGSSIHDQLTVEHVAFTIIPIRPPDKVLEAFPTGDQPK